MKKIIFSLSIALCTFANAQDRSIRPVAGPAPEIQLGATESFVMDNGLKIFVVENHKLPKVSLSLEFKYHPELEGEYVGTAQIAGAMLGTKTATRTKDQINAEVDYIGASLNTSAGGVYASSLKKHLPNLMDVFADVLLNSEFTQEEFDKQITQNASGLASASENPDQIAANVRNVLNFGTKHTYGELMTEKTLEQITLESCVNFKETYFSPKGAYLAIVGDITVDEAQKMLNDYIASWESKNYVNAQYISKKAPKSNQVALVNKSGAVQSVITISYPLAINPSSEDALKLKVLNNILGGGSSARLFRNLREDKAYTYGAYSSVSIDELGSYFKASAKVRNEVTDSAIVEFFREIDSLKNYRITEEELSGVINNMSGKFAIALENASTVARFAINTDYHGLDEDHYATYLKRLAEITVDDIYDVAQKYLKPNNAHIIVVGDASSLSEKLEVFGDLTHYDIYGVEKSDLKPAPDGVTAKSIIADFVEAKGGEKKLKKLSSLEKHYSAEMPGAPAKLSMQVLQKKPNSFVMSLEMMGMVVQKQCFNGSVGYNDGMQGKTEMSQEDIDNAVKEYQLASELNYFENYSANLMGLDELDGEEVYVIVRTDSEGNSATEYYSVGTKLLVKSESMIETPQGEMSQSTLYQDYKRVKGIAFAHKTIQSFGGQAMQMDLEKVIVNKKIDDSNFE